MFNKRPSYAALKEAGKNMRGPKQRQLTEDELSYMAGLAHAQRNGVLFCNPATIIWPNLEAYL